MEDKIRKLLAKAQSSAELGNESEAEAFALKAQELMAKHAIEEWQLKDKKVEATIGFSLIPLAQYEIRHEGLWLLDLFSVIAKNNFCASFRRKDGTIRIVGEADYIAAVVQICESLMGIIRHNCKLSARGYQGNKNSFKRAYFLGAVQGIEAQLREAKIKMAQQEANYGLVLVSKDEKLANWINQNMQVSQSKRVLPHSSALGGAKGFAFGKTVNTKVTSKIG